MLLGKTRTSLTSQAADHYAAPAVAEPDTNYQVNMHFVHYNDINNMIYNFKALYPSKVFNIFMGTFYIEIRNNN